MARPARIAFLVLCAVGVCLAADLIRLHVRVHTDPDFHSYCAISERVDCETVAQSRYAVLAGLPTAVWGLLGYLLLGSLAVWGLRVDLPSRSWPFGALFWLSLFCSLVSVWLLAISVLVVRSTCIVCDASYAVNLTLLALSTFTLRRSGLGPSSALGEELAAARRRPGPLLALFGALALLTASVHAAVPAYWRFSTTTGAAGFPVGRTAEGHWWIGARDPRLEIVEFSDYQCPFCERGHAAIRQLLARHPERVRIVHRHFPLDMACNPMLTAPLHARACRYAALAECAGDQGRFWEASDYLYANGRRDSEIAPEELARVTGVDAERLSACLAGDAPRAAITADIRRGVELSVRGTPTFEIDGRTYPGSIPEEVIRGAIGPD